MTLNFLKHGAAIQTAYDRVAKSKTNDEWFILDYEGNTNVIKVGEEGDYGIDEFCTSFNSGRLQYGVIGVRLAKTSLTKIVLVHWQGEGVPSARVASSTSHIDDVRRFLKSVHVVHYARSEIDVEPDVIRKEVAKLPATHAVTDETTYYSAPTPVGSVYKPVKPHVDINVKERDEFWEHLRKEESSNKGENGVEERKRVESAEREIRESRKADEKPRKEEHGTKSVGTWNNNTQKPQKFGAATAASTLSNAGHHDEIRTVIKNANPMEKPHRTVVTGPSKLRSDRLGMFEKKDEVIPSPTVKPAPFHSQNVKKTDSFQPLASPVLSSGTVSPSHDSVSSSGGLSSFYSPNDSGYEAGASESPKPHDYHAPYEPQTSIPSEPQTSISTNKFKSSASTRDEEPEEPKVPYGAKNSNKISLYDTPPEVPDISKGLSAIALWDYQAADSTEISFDPDDYITEIDQIDPGWWRGRGPNGDVGLFPANYVKLL
ncbi:unnamed protein product [Cylicocyclus nassatus]|uniref:Drebrin-like protein n=1 Tax=Cylicocyclus nassatus TaxID=53992 RepID=A0AA36GTP1_CYLNA|nr:unnamed protein product [Cylicocyclus nassatus]